MINCPVCGSKPESGLCGKCGFDLSCHYEAYPTLACLDVPLKAVSGFRNTNEHSMENVLRCPGCDHTAFSISLTTGNCVCRSCGAELTRVQIDEFLLAQRGTQTHEELKLVRNSAVARKQLAIGTDFLVLLKDGRIDYRGKRPAGSLREIEKWSNIAAVSGYADRLIGLRHDGTLVTAGSAYHDDSEVNYWGNIVDIACGFSHTVGLAADGSVLIADSSGTDWLEVFGWENIKAVSAGKFHAVGLRADGTVMAAGIQSYGRCDVYAWENITSIDAGAYHTVGLCRDGMVEAIGYNRDGQCSVELWRDIVAIAAGDVHTLGLRSDGTVEATGSNYSGQCEVSGWKDIVEIYASGNSSVGVRRDGSIVVAGELARRSSVTR